MFTRQFSDSNLFRIVNIPIYSYQDIIIQSLAYQHLFSMLVAAGLPQSYIDFLVKFEIINSTDYAIGVSDMLQPSNLNIKNKDYTNNYLDPQEYIKPDSQKVYTSKFPIYVTLSDDADFDVDHNGGVVGQGFKKIIQVGVYSNVY